MLRFLAGQAGVNRAERVLEGSGLILRGSADTRIGGKDSETSVIGFSPQG